MIELYKNIKQLRKDMGWSQEELAKKLGYNDRSSIAKIEAGQVDLPRSKIIDFAKAFNVKPGDLMGWDGEVPEYDPDMLTLIDLYSRCDEKGKSAIMSLARTLAD